MPNSKHKLIYERVDLTQNLNLTPLPIIGLDGDSFDYEIDLVAISPVDSVELFCICNGDTTANYRRYLMRGRLSVAASIVDDSASNIELIGSISTGSPSVSRTRITGSSSTEKYFKAQQGKLLATATEVSVHANYWKNQINNLTDLSIETTTNSDTTFTIRIYQIPKGVNLENYDLVDEVGFASRSTDIVFSGLDGDADKEYLLDWNADSIFAITYNNDNTTTYVSQFLHNTNGSLVAINSLHDGVYPNIFKGSASINAISGSKRLTTVSGSKEGVASQQSETADWWPDLISNITDITLKGLSSSTGSVSLYKRKSNKTIDPVPMVTVVDYDVAGVDFSNGITITGIEGDRIEGAIKIEFYGGGVAATGDLDLRFNGDSGSNYDDQSLRGIDNAVSAVSSNSTSLRILYNPKFETIKTTVWIYPQSGQNRPVLIEFETNNNGASYQIWKNAGWWNNSINGIFQIDLFATGSGSLDGNFRVSVPKSTKQASGSFLVTTN